MREQSARDHDIAIIGMAGRFPGAANVAEFWENLKAGIESFSEFSDADLRAAQVDERLIAHPNYVKVRPVLADIRGFDAGFFGYSAREAEVADPQQRIFLECVWEALEQSGYVRKENRGRVGLFAGMNISMYLHDRFIDSAISATMDPHEIIIGNDKDALTTVVAHRLDLTGPAVSVQTFCSTSATAIHLASQSLRHGECELALAGGVCVRVPDRVGYLHVDGGMASPDGHIRTFDEQGRGGVFGDGAAVIVLKPLDRAIADRDTVFAVIRGSAINNDGGAKFSYAAPSVVGQANAVMAALADADVAPADISYVEAHGTATELGDPIEVAALSRAFRGAEKARSGGQLKQRQYCAIGSVKPNVGHLDRAASVTGLIKVVEALRHELIPRSLHYKTPNPEIDFVRSPFYVAAEAVAWPRRPERPRLAGLNGLGMGGTNVHIVLQEAPIPAPRAASPRRWQVLPVSTQSPEASADYGRLMAGHLAAEPRQDLGDIAYTLQMGRKLFADRRVCVASTAADAARALAGIPTDLASLSARHERSRGRPVAFLFAGVGEHYAGMVAQLYRTEPTFRNHLDAAQRLLAEHTSLDVVTPLTAPRPPVEEVRDLAALLGRRADSPTGGLNGTEIAQPAVFAAEYALARTLMDWGVTPVAMLGYSVGEYVAACLAGVMSLADAIRLVAHRAELIGTLATASLLAVNLDWPELNDRVPGIAELGVGLSATGPGQVVVGGPTPGVQALAGRLREAGIGCRELDATHAFHTQMLAPVVAELTRFIAEHITLRAPTIAYVSNVTGTLVNADLVTDPSYWARHMCQPVRFADGLGEILGIEGVALVEIGPGRSLGAMARAHPDCDRSRWPLVVAALPGAGENVEDDRTVAAALAELWLIGANVDWMAYQRSLGDWSPGRVPLPSYPFQRTPYWFNDGWTRALPTSDGSGPHDVASEYETLPLLPESRWLNVAVWHQRAPRPMLVDGGDHWVLFTDSGDADTIAGPLREQLTDDGRQVTIVRPGDRFLAETDGYRIRPDSAADSLRLFAALKQQSRLPDRVVQMWTLRPTTMDDTVRRGMHALAVLARCAHEVGFGTWRLDVITSGTCQVTGTDPIVAERATVLGPCTVLPMEYPGLSLRVIDLPHGTPPPVTAVLAELGGEAGNETVALRGGRRWTPEFEVLEPGTGGARQSRPATSIRTHGVYLITGGLGGIGLAMAERLAEQHQARLVLLSRTPTPPSDQWESILADPAASGEVRRRIQGLHDLRAKGAEFEVVTGNVAELADVRRAVAAAQERFGALHGVLHAAGIPGVGMTQFKTSAEMDRVLAPKVAGTLALATAVRAVPVDFIALFSSVAAVAGALGQADYSAANAFMDAFARAQALPETRVLSIGWGEWTWNGWAGGLDGYDPVLREFYIQHRARFGIDFDAGWRCLLEALACPEPHLIVSTQDFSASARGSRNYTIEDIQAAAKKGRTGSRHPRGELSSLFVAPRDPVESAVAEIWAEALGLEEVGIFDNFFDLGGNSFIGVGIVDAVRRQLGLAFLPGHVIFQSPTVASLIATALSDASPGQPVADESDERARQRERHLARRRATVREAIADGQGDGPG
jgi:acyl transferase domain-containing protein